MDLTGITNENAFYSDHYLRTLLREDVKAWVKEHKQQGEPPYPWTTLQGLRQTWLQCREQFDLADSAQEHLDIQRKFVRQMLNSLDYNTSPEVLELEKGPLPLIARVNRDQQPYLWIVEALDLEGEGVMTIPPDPVLIGGMDVDVPLARLIGEGYFQRSPPRWILMVSLDHLILWDRLKWAGQQALRFSWSDLYASRDTRVVLFQLIAMLLSRSSLVPGGGDSPIADWLDERSKSHAQGVSGSLKYALRAAVELLGNEYVRHDPEVNAEELTVECLRYMYRLLFLFTVEARQQLGYLPMKATLYREGFALEKLRELESASLEEENAGEGVFMHETLMLLFDLVYTGRKVADRQRTIQDGLDTFSIAPLKCELFDPEATPLLSSIQIRNKTWQTILRSLSLGKTKHGMGRISYAQLGINHLGEVYEALLSYVGFIAQEDLYEVKPARETHDLLGPAYFVSREALETQYDDEEIVYDEDGKVVCHPKGRFIYRLTGRARETSASYYTPESLTRCVVRYALKEVMEGKTADELLQITICEPAMGSAAFLNEAVSQLAEAYLDRATRERGELLSPDDYGQHLQRIKLYLADNNVYGVDLNPVAVELGGVSLWLNTLVPGGFVPWFGNQLQCGNALVGAWRRTYPAAVLKKGKWWTAPPQEVKQAQGEIYHFLVGDAGMADYRGKVIKQLAADELEHIKAWKKAFTKRLSDDDLNRLRKLCRVIDELWATHVQDLKRLEKLTTDPFSIYPDAITEERAIGSTGQKDKKLKEIFEGGVNASAYQRLKLVMDYWCALWFWPIRKAHLLPTRREYISDVALILAGKEEADVADVHSTGSRDAIGQMDVAELIDKLPRLQVVEELAKKERFHHWPLVYADQFADRGGFDVVLGNPPWLKSQFVERAVMGDLDPRFVVKKMSAPQVARLREEWTEDPAHARHYLDHYQSMTGLINFQNAAQNYPLLKGMQSNLYKSFITTSWNLSRNATGLLHPGGVYDDGKGAALRQALYPRLRYRFQFRNGLFLFPEVHDQTEFSVNIYGAPRDTPEFVTMANLFDARTVDASFKHDGHGAIPRIKTEYNKWDVSGHKDRLIQVTGDDLKVFAALFDTPGTPAIQAKLPGLHCSPLLESVKALSRVPMRIVDFKARYFATRMWDETGAQKAGIIRQETRFTDRASEWILSGPHFFVGNPYFKTPRSTCKHNQDYDRLDLTTLPADYLPRTNYVPDCDDYQERMPVTQWGRKVTDGYRIGFRRMFGAASERSLIATVVPARVGHIDNVLSISCERVSDLLHVKQGLSTIVLDFLTKISGKTKMDENLWGKFPVVPLDPSAAARTLGLTCLTQDYAGLWNDQTVPKKGLGWSRLDHRLDPEWFAGLTRPWSWESPLRTDYARWQAQLELDVLFARACGLTLEQLCIIYQMQFPVLQNYEKDTWYDRQGRIVFSSKSGEGILPRTRKGKDQCYSLHTPKGSRSNIPLGWKDVHNLQEGTVSYTFTDDTLPGGPTEKTITCHAPFDRPDREEAYREAWEFFERHQNAQG